MTCECMLLHRQALYDYERGKNVRGEFKEPELMIEHVILRGDTCVHHRVIYFNRQRALFPRRFFSPLEKTFYPIRTIQPVPCIIL